MANYPYTLQEILKGIDHNGDSINRYEICKAQGIDEVEIDGNVFRDYKAFSFLWEKTFAKSPTRAQGNGAITNMNSYSTFLTAHLKIDFSMLSIDSYRAIMKLIYSKNEFNVTCYDIVYNRKVTVKMYFATEEMPKLVALAKHLNGEDYMEILGIQDYTVEMIGTNSEEGTVSIVYHSNYPNGTDVTAGSEDLPKGTDFAVKNFTELGFTVPSGYEFLYFEDRNDENNLKYIVGETYIANVQDLVLYAVYSETE